jgi:hypothetical protein
MLCIRICFVPNPAFTKNSLFLSSGFVHTCFNSPTYYLLLYQCHVLVVLRRQKSTFFALDPDRNQCGGPGDTRPGKMYDDD